MKPVYVVGTCDTKEAELRYAVERVTAAGATALYLATGINVLRQGGHGVSAGRWPSLLLCLAPMAVALYAWPSALSATAAATMGAFATLVHKASDLDHGVPVGRFAGNHHRAWEVRVLRPLLFAASCAAFLGMPAVAYAGSALFGGSPAKA